MFFKKKKESFIKRKIKILDKFITNLIIGNAIWSIFGKKKTKPIILIFLDKLWKLYMRYTGKLILLLFKIFGKKEKKKIFFRKKR